VNFTIVRHILVAARRLCSIVAVAILVASGAAAQAANYTDIWWNPGESGWGVTLTHHNDKVFAAWYLYDVDGRPLWMVMTDGQFSNAGRTFSGDLHRASGPSYRNSSFRSADVSMTRVGTARIDFDDDDQNATISFAIDGQAIAKRVKRQPFGSAPANAPNDWGDLWWNPGESGWGLTLNHHGDNLFGVWFTYDDDGRPLWIVMPGGTFTDANTFTGKLYTTSGTPWMLPFDAAKTRVTEVGSATIRFGAGSATFASTVNGLAQTRTIVRQPFGSPPAANRAPVVSLTAAASVNPALAPATITLKATASDPDGTVSKVTFFRGSEMVGEVKTAPFELRLANVAAGVHRFSAMASDDRRGSALAPPVTLEVKSGTVGTSPNKIPSVTIASPSTGAFFAYGAAVPLAATASDSDGAVARVEFFANGAKVAEAVASPWSTAWTGASPGTHSLAAVATDDKGATRTSAAITITVSGPPPIIDASTRDAARFLTQATFGIRSIDEIAALRAQGYESWLAVQFAMAPASHVQYVNERKAAGERADEERAYEAIWQQFLWDPGQLRARMAFALSEIFVISNIAPDLDTYAMASYMDMLNRNAFGNYRQLLEEVTLHPAMGYYLNMIGSRKADPAKGTHPNENYAREVMQLFSIGLVQLGPDGTRVLDGAGNPVPTYDETTVKNMAAALTGWSFAGNDTSKPAVFDPAKENWLEPMVPWEMWHDTGAKTIVGGIGLAPNQGARKDLKDALDALYNHPNVGPFIGRQLIQRFVTSNPSPAYIGRVAAAFANNGQGVRGDLKAMLRAVLLDPEARSLDKTGETGWGKQREPVIRFANYLRGLNATSPTGRNRIWYLDSADGGLNQSPLLSPSVFNFFSPNYRQPGPLSAAGLVAPEFQITTETSLVGGLNFFSKLVRNGSYGSGETKLTLDYAPLIALAADPAAVADRLNLLFFNGAMGAATRAALVTAMGGIAATKPGDRVKAALLLMALSPEFVIQK